MPYTYKDGKVGYSYKEVSDLLWLHQDDVKTLVGQHMLDYFQHDTNSPIYITKASLDVYMQQHVDAIVGRKKKSKRKGRL